jgi:hypothetical protein
MADGKIVRKDRIGSPLEKDVRMWHPSGPGEQVLSSDHVDLQAPCISRLTRSTT